MQRISNIFLSEVMIKEPITVFSDEKFSRVEEIFRSRRIRHLPVIDKGKKLKGLITQTDLYRTVSPFRSMEGEIFYTKELLDSYILSAVMTKEVVTLRSCDILSTAVDIMVRKRFGCIPIIGENYTLEGIITQIDVLMTISKYAGWVI